MGIENKSILPPQVLRSLLSMPWPERATRVQELIGVYESKKLELAKVGERMKERWIERQLAMYDRVIAELYSLLQGSLME